jgi:pimeloyl-ACP methyl ester carboxylesterase
MFPASAPNITVRFITLRTGVCLRVAESGPASGTPVVMLHGWGASLYMYRHALERFPMKGIRTIAVDLRGYGLSDKPLTGDAYSLNTYCSDLDALLDELSLSTTALVGQSMGGGLALRYALSRHDRISKLGLINPTGLARVPYIGVLQLLPTAMVDALGSRAIPRWLVALILRRLAYGDPSAVTQRDIDEYWAPTQLPGFVHAARSALSDFNWSPLTDAEASALAVPSLVVLGTQDRLLANTQAAAARLKGARVEWVPGGHCAHEEHPALVYDMLAAFIR